MDFLEYSDITAEIKGCMTPGKLKLTDQNIIFKNSKTGKVEQIQSADFDVVNFQNFSGTWGIRMFLKNGTLHRFVGFKDSEKEKLAKFFTNTYKIDLLEKELSLKGWNWGTAKFSGSILNFEIGSNSAFEIPLNHVSQCIQGKNEITMEFHQNDDAPVSLMEMRFFIPSNELAGDVDPVEAFQQQVMNKASVINVSGDAIAIFREIQCLTPRGRYDIKIFNTFFQLHGKTFDYKIPMSTVLRLFILPHKDSRQMFFVVSLDPPIKQGQTRYHYLVFLFSNEDETSIELPFTEEEIKDKYEGKLEKDMAGPTYEVLGRIMKIIIGRKLTGAGAFVGHSGTPAIGCSYKAAAGYLYPLERGFIYIHKPPMHIRFEEIASVNFARGGGSTRTFDFEVELKSGTNHTFSSIEKEEYGKFFDFIMTKKLNIKNRGKSDKASYKDDFGNSDDEAAPDAYLERVKAEAQERDDFQSEEEESTDEDFEPNQNESDVAEEFDSNPSSSSDEEGGDGDAGSGSEKKEKKHKKERKERKTKTISEKPRRKGKKKDRDENKPKRPSTAFMLWLNESREKIKSENPGIKVTEIAKRGGELWRELKDKSEWENKATKQKEIYAKAMEEYNASGNAEAYKEKEKERKASLKSEKKSSSSKSEKKPSSSSTKKKTSTSVSSSVSPNKSIVFKSKEYISEDESSSDDDDGDKKKKSVKKAANKSHSGSDSESDNKKGSKRKKESDEESDKKKKTKPKKKDDSDEDKDSSKSKSKKGDEDQKRSKPKSKSKKDDSDEDTKKKSKSKKDESDDDEEFDEEESAADTSEVEDSD